MHAAMQIYGVRDLPPNLQSVAGLCPVRNVAAHFSWRCWKASQDEKGMAWGARASREEKWFDVVSGGQHTTACAATVI